MVAAGLAASISDAMRTPGRRKQSKGKLGLSVAMLLALSAVVQADPVVELTTYNFAPNLIQQAIPIYVWQNPNTGRFTGTPFPHSGVQGLDLNLTINDGLGHASNGGPVFHLGTPNAPGTNTVGQGSSGYVAGNTPATIKQGADVVTGTIFAPTNHSSPGDGNYSTSQDLEAVIVAIVGFATMSTTPGVSLLATIYIDTVGVAPGTDWHLYIGQRFNDDYLSPNFFPYPRDGPTDFGDGGSFNTVLVDGIIHITPEPPSKVLALLAIAGLGAVAIRRRRARRA